MHDDENTAVEAGLLLLSQRGGRLLELRHTGERLIEFSIAGQQYRIDPNRIFTDEGARKTLQRYSSYSPAAFRAVRGFANQLLSVYGLDQSELILTLHNNSEAEYSLQSYLPEGEYADDASQVHLEDGSDPDDFFFVTAPHLFEAFRDSGFNVVLQDNANVSDDGSLSVLAGAKGIPYVNVEAEHGKLEEQIKMLQAVYEVVSK
jgi:hypothetical protein